MTAAVNAKAHNADSPARCTVVIASKNRCAELADAITSTLNQTAPLELVVIDDASTDATHETIASRFPQIRYERAERSQGYIVQRNRAAHLALTPVIVSIDDDAVFPSPHTIEQTLADLDVDPRVGAVAIPFVNVLRAPDVLQRAPGAGIWVGASYVGTAHAVRRDVFLALGGYREALVHQGEEGEFCLRMLAAGYVVRAGTADPLHHRESPHRDLTNLFRWNARNNVLATWHNVPAPQVTARLAAKSWNLLRWGWRHRRLRPTYEGLRAGWTEVLARRVERRPVGRHAYALYRRLERTGWVPLDLIAPALAALAVNAAPALPIRGVSLTAAPREGSRA